MYNRYIFKKDGEGTFEQMLKDIGLSWERAFSQRGQGLSPRGSSVLVVFLNNMEVGIISEFLSVSLEFMSGCDLQVIMTTLAFILSKIGNYWSGLSNIVDL